MRTGGRAGAAGGTRRGKTLRAAAILCALLAGVGVAVAVAASGPGRFDPSFGTSGTTVLERPTSTFPTPSALAPAGKIVVVSSGPEGEKEKVFATRLLPGGQPDPTFGTGGKATIESSSYIGAFGAAVQPDGKVLVVGYRAGSEADTAIAWRLTASGALDETFGVGGVAELSGATSNYATAVAVQPNGKIVVAGNVLEQPNPYRVAVWRLNVSGTPDPTFDTDGVAGISDTAEDKVNAIALQPDGKILVAGETGLATSKNDAAVWRLKPDGGPGGLNEALDPTFDVDGQADVDNGGNERATAVAVQPDGKIVLAGYTEGGPLGSDALVWRLTANGGTGNLTNQALDTSFGNAGAAALGGPGDYARAAAVQLQGDGKILAAGEQKIGAGPFEAVLWRLTSSGGSTAVGSGLDAAFGTGGAASVSAGSGASASSLALQPDRRIVVAGSSFGGNLLMFRVLGDPFGLSVAKAGSGAGTVSSSPAGIACGAACAALMDDGSQVALSASPAAGSAFAGWSGGGCGGISSCTLTMDSDRTVTATFAAVTPAASHAPVITSAVQSHSVWREGSKLASLARARRHRAPLGTTFSFKLDQAATVRLAFSQAASGRRVNGRCVAPTAKNRRRHACQRTLTRGVLVLSGHAGLNKIAFQGRITRSKKLPLGRYTVLLSASNGARQRSAVRALRFRIVR
jgi:uncharacterized delta-60 repeat protein